MPLEIRAGESPGVFLLEGELDMATAWVLEALAGRDDSTGQLVLDASRLRFMDGSGLRALLRLASERSNGVPVVLRNASPSVRRVVHIVVPTGADGLEITP